MFLKLTTKSGVLLVLLLQIIPNACSGSSSSSLPSSATPGFLDNELPYEKLAACLAATGLSIGELQQLAKEASSDSKLKDKVVEQAELYNKQMAASARNTQEPESSGGGESSSSIFNFNKIREKVQFNNFALQPRKSGGNRWRRINKQDEEKIKLFCSSMEEIEDLRSSQMSKLKRALRVKSDLPSEVKLSDPTITPYLSPKVRAVIEAFPLQAEEIVQKYGLNSDEFNEMMKETQTNPLFRRKVKKLLNGEK